MLDIDDYFRPIVSNTRRSPSSHFPPSKQTLTTSSLVLRQRQLDSLQQSTNPSKMSTAEHFQFPASWQQQLSRKLSESSNTRASVMKSDFSCYPQLSKLNGKENSLLKTPVCSQTSRYGLSDQLTLSVPSLRVNYSSWGNRLPYSSIPSPASPTFSDSHTPQSSPEKCSGQLDSNKPRYKTELCKRFEACQKCEYGSKCQYAHGTDELRLPSRHPKYKSQFCEQYHENGTCLYGRRCDFIHSETMERLTEIRYHIHLYHRFREAFPDKAKDVTIRMLLDYAKHLSPESPAVSPLLQQQFLHRQQRLVETQPGGTSTTTTSTASSSTANPLNDIAAELLLRQQHQLRSALSSTPLSLNWNLLDSIIMP